VREVICATNESVQLAQLLALLINEQFRVTDNIDEENVPYLQPRISSRHPAQFRTPAYSATTLFFGRFIGDSAKREIARGITLPAGLCEQCRQAFRQ